jgi:t-SNARE complex subunit (syntaxin)
MNDSLFDDNELENVEKNMNDLKKSMDILNELVSDQQREYDTIEQFIDRSKKETTEGSNDLIEAKDVKDAKDSYISYIIGGLSLIAIFFMNL